MLQPTTNESNEVLPRPVAASVPDSTGTAPSKLRISFKVLAGLGLIYGVLVTAIGVSIGSPGYAGSLAIFWVLSTLSAWAVTLLGMWSARSPGRLFVHGFRCVLLGVYGVHLWVGKSIVKQKFKLSDSDSMYPTSLNDFRLITLIAFGYAINLFYVEATTNLKHWHPPDKPGDSDGGSIISDLRSWVTSFPFPCPTEQPPEAHEMSGCPQQNSGNFQTWFSHMARWNQRPLASNLSLSDSQEKLLPDNCDAV